eukprot:gb/GEZN01002289.1/.p1 GENE.gb/GEZN01002289.1/~~gb/GEZN01002289.1/.p1  ORF type:complete len:637 (-),score=109.60 gb/GEZN01002289.1/:599-2509(-)
MFRSKKDKWARLGVNDIVSTQCGSCQSQILFPGDTEHARCGVCHAVLEPPQTVFVREDLQLQDLELDEKLDPAGFDMKEEKNTQKESIATISNVMPFEYTDSPFMWAMTQNIFFSLLFPCCVLRSFAKQNARFCLSEWWWRVHTFLFAVVIAFWFTYFPYIGPNVFLPSPADHASRYEEFPQDSAYRDILLQDCWQPDDCVPRYLYCPQSQGWETVCPVDPYWSYWCDVAECNQWKFFPECRQKCQADFFAQEPAVGSACPLSLDADGGYDVYADLCPPVSWNQAQEPIYYTNMTADFCPNKWFRSKCKVQTVSPASWCVFASLLTIMSTSVFQALKSHFVWVFRANDPCSFSRTVRILLVDVSIPVLFLFSIVVLAAVKHHQLMYVGPNSECHILHTGDHECERPEPSGGPVEVWWALSLMLAVPLQLLMSIFQFKYKRWKRTTNLRRMGIEGYSLWGASAAISLRANLLLPECPPSMDENPFGEAEEVAEEAKAPPSPGHPSSSPVSPASPEPEAPDSSPRKRTPKKQARPRNQESEEKKGGEEEEGTVASEELVSPGQEKKKEATKAMQGLEAMQWEQEEEMFKLRPTDETLGVPFGPAKSRFLAAMLVLCSFTLGIGSAVFAFSGALKRHSK